MKLIDKDTLVAEIDRQIELLKPFLGACAGQIVAEATDKLSVLEGLKNFLDTLEVKKVDLNEETLHSELRKIYTSIYDNKDIKSAKHFFELGLKAQIMTSKLQQRISVLKMDFWTGLQSFNESEMTLSDAYNQGVDDILEELGLKAQKGE